MHCSCHSSKNLKPRLLRRIIPRSSQKVVCDTLPRNMRSWLMTITAPRKSLIIFPAFQSSAYPDGWSARPTAEYRVLRPEPWPVRLFSLAAGTAVRGLPVANVKLFNQNVSFELLMFFVFAQTGKNHVAQSFVGRKSGSCGI